MAIISRLRLLMEAKDFTKLALLQEGANAVSESKESKKQFLTYRNELNRLMKYLDRNDISANDRAYKDAIVAICEELRKKTCRQCRLNGSD
jgi:type I restriction enzyme R subunit